MTQTTTATRRPVEVDTQLAALHAESAKVGARIDGAIKDAHYRVGDRGRYVTRTRKVYDLSTEQAIARLREIAADETAGYRRAEAQRNLDTIDEGRARLAAIREQAAPLNAEYQADPWSRFFLVQDGHIHSSMSCHSCTPTTAFGWLPTLSGLTEADAVAQEGALLCTFCYPSAPVEWTNGREVAEAARAAARCAGSGEYVPGTKRYVKCPDCSYIGARTPSGFVRAHKPAGK